MRDSCLLETAGRHLSWDRRRGLRGGCRLVRDAAKRVIITTGRAVSASISRNAPEQVILTAGRAVTASISRHVPKQVLLIRRVLTAGAAVVRAALCVTCRQSSGLSEQRAGAWALRSRAAPSGGC